MRQVKVVSEEIRSADGRAIATAKSVVVSSSDVATQQAVTQQTVHVEISQNGTVSRASASSSSSRG